MDLTSAALIDRRSLLLTGAGALFLSPAGTAVEQSPSIYRWWPRFPVAKQLWVVPFAGDVEDGAILESAAGLAARAALTGPWRSFIYEDMENDGYRRWFHAYCRAHKPNVVRMDLDEAVDRLRRANIVRGHLLYRHDASVRPLHSDGAIDESLNVATSLAASLHALTVSERMVARMVKLGVAQVLDVRDRSESWCLEAYGDTFSRRLVGTADPKTRNARSLMVALGAFVCSGRGDAYSRALARCEPDTPVLGWGCGGEDTQTIPSSRHGLYQTATNWCHNLPVFAGDKVPDARMRVKRTVDWRDLDWGDGKHYASYVMSDGDNVQWLMGNFVGGTEGPSYYNNPRRGAIPFGWGVSAPSLAQLSPRTLEEIITRATPNDDFLLFSAGGYFYPDLYGQARGSRRALELHADRMRGYMDLTGIRVLAFNFQDWDSTEALAACEVFAKRMPGLLGILAFQYYPYSGGEGSIRWVKGADGDTPVVSCRLCIWAQTGRPRDTTPAGVAAWLNRQPVVAGAANDDGFSWIIAHAWSRFRKSAADAPISAEEADVPQDREAPGTARGYDPAVWSVERLGPTVKAVTPQELLWRVRLRLRPAQTLAACARDVHARAAGSRDQAGVRAVLRQAEGLLARVDADPGAAQRCFDLLKRADAAMGRIRPDHP